MSSSTSMQPRAVSDDSELVVRCLEGEEQAWSEFVDKYKNLIYSIPIRLGFSREDAGEVFQSVCLTTLSELAKLREVRALPCWLVQVTTHTCYRWNKERGRYAALDADAEQASPDISMPDEVIQNFEREQMVRNALSEASAYCQELLRLLFYAHPPVPYDEVAKRLGRAKGSLGATRMRCLEKLRRALEKRGFR